jgi:serine/threonine-protein kinase
VYAAWDELLEREVAVKFLHLGRDDATRRALLREARLLCRLDHPNVCRVFDLVVDQGRDVLVLERILGEPLACLNFDAARRRASDLARQIAEALAAAHAVGVIHRDLKPDNVLVTPDGIAKVLDFGLATLIEQTDEPAAGTLDWMSPEQARGEPTGPATDVYSLGLMLHRLLTGRLPYPDVPSFGGRLAQRRAGSVELATELTARPRALLLRLLDPQPARRPTAAEAAVELERLSGAGRRRRVLRRRVLGGLAIALVATAPISWWLDRRAASERRDAATIRLTIERLSVDSSTARPEVELLEGYREALAQRLRRLRGVAVLETESAASTIPPDGAEWRLALTVRRSTERQWEIFARVVSAGREQRNLSRADDAARAFAQLGDWLEEQLGSPRGLSAGLRDPFTIQLFALARQEMALRGFASAKPFYETLAALEPNLAFARIQIANGLWQEGRVEEADATWRALLAGGQLTDEERAETLYNLIFDAAERHDAEQYGNLLLEFDGLLKAAPSVEPLYWEAKASAELHFGRAGESVAGYRHLEALYRQRGNTMARADAMCNLADALLYERQLDEARDLLVEVAAIANTLDSRRLTANTEVVWARWAVLAGDSKALASALQRARLAATQIADKPLLAELERIELLADLRFGDPRPAETRARSEAARLAAAGRLGDRSDFLYEAAMALEARGETSRATTLERLAADRIR